MPRKAGAKRLRIEASDGTKLSTGPRKLAKGVTTVARTSKRQHANSTTTTIESTTTSPPSDASTTRIETPKRLKIAAPSSPPPSVTQAHARPYEPSLLPPTISFSLSTAVSHLSTHDARFRLMFRHLSCTPFQPPYTAIDPFKTLVTSIIGQQVSWLAARAINKRFRALFAFEDEEGFPGPADVAAGEVSVLKGAGLSTRKAEYVIELARHFLDGRLSTELLRDGTDEEIAKALIAVRGIGQWTVDMFLMFSLRRPDVLPVGDLGVQKGLLRWALAAHGALTASKGKGKVHPDFAAKYAVIDRVDENGNGEIDTLVERPATPPPGHAPRVPPTPMTPNNITTTVAILHTPGMPQTPPTPVTPAETLEIPLKELPPPAPEILLAALPQEPGWDAHRAAPLGEGLTIETLKSRLAGKKVKGGAYLTPKEMEALTEGWRPHRSLGVYYMWPAGEDF